MATLCKTFSDWEPALGAVRALRLAGADAGDVGLLCPAQGSGRDARDGQPAAFGGRICSVTWSDGDQHVEATDAAGARRALVRARVPDHVAGRMLAHLNDGEAVMFVELAQLDLHTVEQAIGRGRATKRRGRSHRRSEAGSWPS
jgi:hypothetical protein